MKQCAQGSFREGIGKHKKNPKMAIQQEERLSDVVRTYPVFYDKTDRYFKDKARKQLAWEDGRCGQRD